MTEASAASNANKPLYVSELEEAFGGPSTSSFGTAVFFDSASEGKQDSDAPPPPPQFAGHWIARPSKDVTLALTLTAEGSFTWAVTQSGRTQTIQGQAGYQNGLLILGQKEGPPLTGLATLDAANSSLTFKPPGAPADVAGLTFSRQSS